jgi:hypothetical protein
MKDNTFTNNGQSLDRQLHFARIYLHHKGWKVIRVKPGTKEPYGKGWQNQGELSNKELAKRLSDKVWNVGVLLGESSGGVSWY